MDDISNRDDSSNCLDVLNNCESKILYLLSITQETLQEFQNLPNCESYKLEGFSQSYLDTIVYIQTNLKNITIPNAKVSDESAPKSPGKSSVDSCNVSNKIHDGDVSVVIKKIEVMKAVYDMNQDQEEKMEVY